MSDAAADKETTVPKEEPTDTKDTKETREDSAPENKSEESKPESESKPQESKSDDKAESKPESSEAEAKESPNLEQDENVLFAKRSKLFRFSKDDNEWKERGTGDIKILKHKTTGKVRVLMRREKVLKICANHHITADMELSPNVGSDRSWVWNVAADFAEGEQSAETLAVRFPNSDIAKEFKEVFDRQKEALKEAK